jgi:hypothetical protein
MKSANRLLAAALSAALLLRLCLLLLPTAPLKAKAMEPTGDSPEYVRLATNLVRRHIFSQDSTPPFRPDMLRTPVYPAFLALLLAVCGSSLVWPILLQVLLSLAVVLFTRQLALELGLAPVTSGLAALLVALSPNLVFYSIKLTTETQFVTLLLVTLLLVNRLRARHRWRELVASGVCCGLLILTRPIAVLLPLLLALYVLWLVRRPPFIVHRSPFIAPLVLLASTSVVVAPWVIRNGRVGGRYTISTAFDYNISEYSGALTLAAARLMPVNEARESLAAEAQTQYGPLDENDQARYWMAMAKVGRHQVLSRPLLAMKIHAAGSAGGLLMPSSIRTLRVFSGQDPLAGAGTDPHAAQQTIQLVARAKFGQALGLIWNERLAKMSGLAIAILAYAILFHFTLLVASVVSLFRKRSRRLLWLLLPILYFVLSTGPVGEARFRVPIEPLLCLFAAMALTRVPRPTPHTVLSQSRLP